LPKNKEVPDHKFGVPPVRWYANYRTLLSNKRNKLPRSMLIGCFISNYFSNWSKTSLVKPIIQKIIHSVLNLFCNIGKKFSREFFTMIELTDIKSSFIDWRSNKSGTSVSGLPFLTDSNKSFQSSFQLSVPASLPCFSTFLQRQHHPNTVVQNPSCLRRFFNFRKASDCTSQLNSGLERGSSSVAGL
jgi:hypothetical protein